MKRATLLCAVAGLVLVACNKSDPSATSAGGNGGNSSGGSVLTAPVDYLNDAAKAEHSAVKTIDTTSVSDAIQLFYSEKGRYPKDLNELVTEKYISKIPATPFGTRLDYDPASGTVKVVNQ